MSGETRDVFSVVYGFGRGWDGLCSIQLSVLVERSALSFLMILSAMTALTRSLGATAIRGAMRKLASKTSRKIYVVRH